MTSQHDPIMIKPINEVAEYLKNLVPPNIPEMYSLKPMIKNISDEENIRSGVIAFRDFIYLFCDCLISAGSAYAKPPKKPSGMKDYPFLHNITNLLIDIGYYGILSANGHSLLIADLPLCIATIDANGKKKPPKVSANAKAECFKFLTLCGFIFTDTEVFYPRNPLMLTGLKALSVADMELRTDRRYWNDNYLLRCNYRLIKAEEADIAEELEDFLHPLSDKLREFAIKLHKRYVGMGMTCTLSILRDTSYSYGYISKNRKISSSRDEYALRVFEFCYSLRNGYCLFVRAKKTAKYADIIAAFPQDLREKITAGYGCYKKLGGTRCQGECQGICIPLDDKMLGIREEIERWLDKEAE